MPAVFVYLLAFLGLLLFIWIARRLLGVHSLSATRSIAAAVIGLGIGLIIGVYVFQREADADLALLTGVIFGFLFTMLTVILFEVLLGRRRSRPDANIFRRLGDRFDVARRTAEVTRIFARHGLERGYGLVRGREITSEEALALGNSMRDAFQEAGGVFIKLGQLLATRPDVLPVETAKQLEGLQLDVDPTPENEVRPVLEAALGATTEEVFTEFDWSPIGSASIGQVYRAVTTDGSAVVVKVRRPGIVANIDRDLNVLEDIAAVAAKQSAQARQLGLDDVVAEFSAQLRAELDYSNEARNVTDVAYAFADHRRIVVPRVHEDLSTDDVLVLDYLDGVPLTGREGTNMAGGHELADALFTAELNAMVNGDAFHADLHPGNVLTMDVGGLGLVDFGAVGRLDAFERAAVSDILTAVDVNDPTMLREAALEVGMKGDDLDPATLDRAFSRLMADHLGSGRDPSVEVLTDFMTISQRHGLRMPPSVSAMLRALVTLDSSIRILDPNYGLVAAAQRMARQEVVQYLSPETLSDDLRREVVRLAPMLRRAPYQIDRIAGQLARGRLGMRVSLFSGEEDTRWLGNMINRSLLAFIGSILGIVSVMLFQVQDGPQLTEHLTLFDLLGFVGLFAGAILIMRVVLEILKER